MQMNNIGEVVRSNNVIGITFHISPDGDSLGSALALMLGLRKLNKKAYIVSKERIPSNYSFLPNCEEIDGTCTRVSEDTGCLIALDCGNRERLNADLDPLVKEYTLVNIDHHLSNDMYGDINYVDTSSAAVGELVYQILDMLSVDVDKDIAACLYTSIVTDCGSFKYSNTTPRTLEIAGKLIKTGINFTEIQRLIYENKEFNRIKLYGKVIESMYLDLNSKFCVMQLTEDMLSEHSLEISDTSDIISIGMEIDSVEVAALFKEKDDTIKISLRSKQSFDVRKVAEAFGGGGHSRAAGLRINKPMKEAIEAVRKLVEKELI